MSRQDDRMKDYIAQVVALREARERNLSEQELRDIARDIGLSDDDLIAADLAAQDHFTRGERFAQHQRWDDAIAELQRSVALAPGKLPPRAALAHVFAKRWQQRGSEPDRHAAASLARECIALEPHHQSSYKLLNQLDSAPTTTAPHQRASSAPHHQPTAKAGLVVFIALSCLLLLGGGAAAAFFIMAPVSVSDGPQPQPAAPEVISHAIPQPASSTPPRDASAAGRVDFPVQIDLPADSPLQLDALIHSELKVYNPAEGQGFYTGILRLKNTTSDQEVMTPKLELVFKDAAGENVAVQSVTAGLSFKPEPLRPGDTHAVRTIRKLPASAVSATLTMERLTTQPAPSRYPDPEPVPLTWIVKSPLSDDLTVHAREVSAAHYTGNSYLKVAWVAKNDSAQPIKMIKGRIVMLGKDNAPGQSHDLFLVSTMEAPLMPGEARLFYRTFKTSADHTGYQVELTELQPLDKF